VAVVAIGGDGGLFGFCMGVSVLHLAVTSWGDPRLYYTWDSPQNIRLIGAKPLSPDHPCRLPHSNSKKGEIERSKLQGIASSWEIIL
jgi:hypothetical protein